MDDKQQNPIDGPYFGWTVVTILTLFWLIGVSLWLQSLWVPESYYEQIKSLFPGALPFVGWTLTFTLAVLWGGLLWSSRRQAASPVPLLSAAELMELAPRQFEKHVALIFTLKGFRVRHRGKSGDHGVDLEVRPSTGRLGVVQCKRYRSTVGEQVVRDLYGTMLHERAAHAFLVTAGKISAAARSWAEEKPITLVDGSRLQELAKELAR
jgi:restriction system protein